MNKLTSLMLALSLLLSFSFISNNASARKLSDDELRARAMDESRTLQSRIRALKKLYAHMLIDGEIPSRRTCVWDVLGKQGPIYASAVDQQLRLKHYGITIEVEAYADEQQVVEKLKSGHCDASVMSGAKAREFNHFTGSIEALGGVPTKQHMKYLLQVLSSPQAHKKMVQDKYHVVGIIPIGFNYLFTHDGKRPTLDRSLNSKRKASVVKGDVSQNVLFNHFDIKVTPWDNTAAAAGAYNLAEADLFMAPLVAYNMFNLGSGLKHGSIIDFPLSQMTLQVVARLDTIPMEVGQFLREDMFLKLNLLYREVEKNSREVPKEKMYKLSARDEKILNNKIAMVRDQLSQDNAYNPSMIRLQKNIRCKIDKTLKECKK